MANLKFSTQKPQVQNINKRKHIMLVVDDDESIHEVTRLALNSITYPDLDIEIVDAYNVDEAKALLNSDKNISMALLDVVMESPQAGLDLVDYIRKEKCNNMIRLVMRTGQANKFPPLEVVQKYDINDFKEKTELTIEKLYTTIRNSIKQYEQLQDLKKENHQTYLQLTTNILTKAPNRVSLTKKLESNSNEKTLIMIDVVGFSLINESNGYESGDTFLISFNQYLLKLFSNHYQIFHLHGDLFALLIEQPFDNEIHDAMTQLVKEVSSSDFHFGQIKRRVFLRVGIASGNDEELLRKSELALKESKLSYTNAVSLYSPNLNIIGTINQNSHWTPIFKDALEQGNFVAYYQPIVDIKSGHIFKYEALVRLNHNDQVYSPCVFLDAAKHNGTLSDIFAIMLEHACQQAAITGSNFSVNIQATEFIYSGLLNFIKKTLQKHNVSPGLITLEILEDISINRDSVIRERINEIHDLGLKLAIDDFGVNCSNFGQLVSLPIDYIKIDGSFVKNVLTSHNSQIVIKTIVTYAKERGIKLIAEYVSDQKILEYIKGAGVDYAQGYHFGEPNPLPQTVLLNKIDLDK